MDVKVREFLEEKQIAENAALLKEKQQLLRRLNLFEKVEVGKDDGYDSYVYNHELGKYIFYKYVYPEITDEEYKKLLKYDVSSGDNEEGNGESGLNIIALINLVVSVVACFICFVSASTGRGVNWSYIISGAVILLAGLVQFWTMKVFTNVSRKATDIYELLKSKE